MNKKIVGLLILITFLGLFLHFYKLDKAPPCLNADEAAFSYNAFSILKTGKDEFGSFLPLRLKSFGDNKMPLLSYLTIPFIALFGLNEWSIILINVFILTVFPTVLYCFTHLLFKDQKISLLTSLFFVLSWSVQSMGRQLHEALLTGFIITCTSYFFIMAHDKKDLKFKFLFILFNFLSLFSYQSSRIFACFFALISLIYLLRKKINWRFFLVFLSTLIIFGVTDIIYKPQRVTNLLFFNKIDFSTQINEFRGEGGSKLAYNKLTVGLKDMLYKYLDYFSPQFFVTNGDANLRFGYPGLSIINIVEFIFFFIGLYFLFKNKERFRFYILALFLISPLSASLSWTGLSLTRSFFIIIPILVISSYGVIKFIQGFKGKSRLILINIISIFYLIFIFYNWDFYLNHYPKKAMVIHAWQCGYKELSQYIKENYDKYDHFYISKENGPPYIFLLFYLKYPPEKFYPQAKLSQLDEYGFGQVDKFDKFIFNLDVAKNDSNFVTISRPLETSNGSSTKKIMTEHEEMFWINESY